VPGEFDDGAVQGGGEVAAFAGPAVHDDEALGVRLVSGLGHGDVRQVTPVRRVARLLVQGRVRREAFGIAAGQGDAVQVEVRAQRRLRRGDADIAQLGALGGEVEVVPAGQGDRRRVEVAGGQIAHRAAGQLHMEDMVAGVAEPVVPLPVQQPVDGPGGAHGQFRRVGILRPRLPLRHFAHRAHQPAAVGKPERRPDVGLGMGQPAGLAAVGGDEPEVRDAVPVRDEGDDPAVGGPAGGVIRLRPGGQPARLAAVEGHEPDVTVGGVLGQRHAGDGDGHVAAVGRHLRIGHLENAVQVFGL